VDRMTGRETGEIEGGEPIMVLSRNTYANNKSMVDMLLESSLHRNGAPIMAKNGAMMTVSHSARMMANGGMADVNSILGDASSQVAEYKQLQLSLNSDQKSTAESAAAMVTGLKAVKTELSQQTGLLGGILEKDNGAGAIMHSIQRLRDNMNKANAA
jgi:hypothetical protein